MGGCHSIYPQHIPLLSRLSTILPHHCRRPMCTQVEGLFKQHSKCYVCASTLNTFASGKYSGCKPSLAITVTLDPNLTYKSVNLSKAKSLDEGNRRKKRHLRLSYVLQAVLTASEARSLGREQSTACPPRSLAACAPAWRGNCGTRD